MAHYIDLTACDYFPHSEGLGFRAAGWLERGHSYAQGDVSAAFFEKLCIALQNPWEPPMACGGRHRCDLCRFSGGGSGTQFKGLAFDQSGSGSLFVPQGGLVYVAPSSIAHYVDAHGYCPPAVFQDAIMSLPEMRSPAYLKALMETPVKNWLSKLRA